MFVVLPESAARPQLTHTIAAKREREGGRALSLTKVSLSNVNYLANWANRGWGLG